MVAPELRVALQGGGAAAAGPLALGDRAGAGGAQLAQLLVQAGAVALDVMRARSTIARLLWRSSRAAWPRRAARALAQSTGTAASAACVGVEHATAATSSISVWSE